MFIRLIMACALTATMAACAGPGGSPDDVTLTIMGFDTGDTVDRIRFDLANEAIAPSAAEASPGGFDAQALLTTGNPPDLVYLDRRLIGTYAAKNTLLPLTDCVDRETLAQYREPALAEATLDSRLYGLPDYAVNHVLMLNDTALAEVNLEPEAVDTGDRQALSTAAARLFKTDGDRIQRIGFDPRLPEFLPLWAHANGASLVSADGKTARLTDPKVVEVLEHTVGLINEQGGWPAFRSFRDSLGARNPFAAGRLGASPMEDSHLTVLAGKTPQAKVTVAPFRDVDGRPIDWITGHAWAVPAVGRNTGIACKWIKAMTASDTWIEAARADRRAVFTGNKKADEVIFTEVVEPSGDLRTVLQAQESGFAEPATAAAEEFRAAWQSAVTRVLNGEQHLAQALDQAQREAQAALDKA